MSDTQEKQTISSNQLSTIIRNGVVLSTDNGQPYIAYDDEAIEQIQQLIDTATREVYKNGFYAACGVAGLEMHQAHYAWEQFTKLQEQSGERDGDS